MFASAFALIGVLLLAFSSAETTSPYQVSSDKRYIIDSNGQPLFINGDAAWSLFAELDQQETLEYLNDRQEKGINLLMVNVIEYAFSSDPPNNAYGEGPFTTPNDFSTPNEAYFQHVDWAIEEATNRGFTLLLIPSYIGYGGPGTNQGWYDEMVDNGPQKMYDFGHFLGTRYKDYQNIIWANGGDWNPPDKTLVDEMAKGIKDADPDNLHTAHTAPNQEASSYWDGYEWLDIDNVYNYNNVYYPSEYLYQNFDRPFFMLESTYENEHGVSQRQLRAQAYQSVLSGAMGHVFGNCPMWHFASNNGWCDDSSVSWQEALDLQGSQSMQHFGNLFRSREWHKLEPDFNFETLVSGYASTGWKENYAYDLAARTSDGNTAIAYYHDNRTMTFDLSRISGTNVQAWWFNPANGQATDAGTFPASGTQAFAAPSGNTDWILVLDNADSGFDAPGTSSPPSDTTNPTVTLLSPSDGATLSGSVTLSADASDNVGVSSVEFYIDQTLIGSPDTTSPYEISLDTSTLTNGAHQISVVAYDDAGNQNETVPVSVTVENIHIPEDINEDGKVDLLDFSLLASKFGQSGPDVGREDINRDSNVDLLDFSLLAAKFGQSGFAGPGTAEKPGPTNTGPRHPDGTAMSDSEASSLLTHMTGSEVRSEMDAGRRLFENVYITGGVTVTQDNVTFKNFVMNAGGALYGFKLTSYSPVNTVLEDGEIFDVSSAHVAGSNYRVTRVDLHESNGDALKILGSNITIEESWCHHLGRGEGAHADCAQSQSSDAVNVVMRGNNCDMPVNEKGGPGDPYKSNACYLGGIADLTIEDNWLNGGNYTLYCSSGTVVRNNKFGRQYRYGIRNSCDNWTNNTWEDTGEPA